MRRITSSCHWPRLRHNAAAPRRRRAGRSVTLRPVTRGAQTPVRSLGVLVCSYLRPDHLRRCVTALAAQTRLPDDVIVAHRIDDDATRRCLEELRWLGLPLRAVILDVPGVVAARNVGLRACRTDVLAQIDDDTAPHPDWCARILGHFQADPSLGGLSGRDRVHDGVAFDEVRAEPVGVLQWHGRVIGNHHRGQGAPRRIQVFKGANMAFRAEATAGLLFDARLRGSGAQPHEDVAFSLAVGRRGWRLLYDPAVALDHYAGRAEARPYSSVGRMESRQACHDSAFNMVIALWDELGPARRAAFLLWSLLVGTGPEPGLAQAIRYTRLAGIDSWRRFLATQAGKVHGFLLLAHAGRHEKAWRTIASK